MAACGLGGSLNIKLFCFHSEIKKIRYSNCLTPYKTTCRPESPYGLRKIETRHEPVHAGGSKRQPYRLTDTLAMSCVPVHSGTSDLDVSSEEEKSNQEYVVPGSSEVQSLLETICDTTSIAEFKLSLAGFRLYVKRNLVEKNVPLPAPSLPPIQNISNQNPESNGSATATSLVISQPKTSSEGIQRLRDTASDEGLVILRSPKVGLFRRSRTIKGKKAPPSCKEKQVVEEGQVLCYIEQLAGEVPIESDVSGEVVKMLRVDGEPVGYDDALISILPSFPGIKKLQ